MSNEVREVVANFDNFLIVESAEMRLPFIHSFILYCKLYYSVYQRT